MTHLEAEWEPYVYCNTYEDQTTGLEIDSLIKIGQASIRIESDVSLHKTLKRAFVEARTKRLVSAQENNDEKCLDFATCEAMALGSLLQEGNFVRFCGQDSGRGTFSHRHFEITCQTSGHRSVPLESLGGTFEIVNSHLSELAVVAFEYGISIDSPKNLVIWEAQFGDFFNQGQVSFDAFLCGSHEKWQRPTAMTILLPHGYDGAGPEHSSCRLERFLQMSNESFLNIDSNFSKSIPNWRVINPTTPANMYHALRRQLVSDFRVPLIVAAPKAILRHPMAQSSIKEIGPDSKFEPVIDDMQNMTGNQVVSVLWCSGKTYYDLVAERERRNFSPETHPIVRVEELVPFPFAEIQKVAEKYSSASQFLWCQEEHENMGAWTHVYPRFYHAFADIALLYAGRAPGATPAVGIPDVHKKQVAAYFEAAFE